MSETTDTGVARTSRACPECGEPMPIDERFTAWCAGCAWNVDPSGAVAPVPERGGLKAFEQALAARHAEQLYTELAHGGAAGAPRRDAAALGAYAVAAAVHLVTVALAVAGLLLIVLGWHTVVQPVAGVALLALAVLLRPRLAELPDDAPVLRRADAPRLYALLDEIADEAGTRRIDAVVVVAHPNAAVWTYGVRRRRVLEIGLGLWEILTPQQRLALLGHEFGHYANGDSRHGLVVHTALRALSTWYYVLTPDVRPVGPAAVVAAGLMRCVRFAAYSLLRLLDVLTLRAAQRAEYLADRMAARLASTAATVELLDRLLLADSVSNALRQQVVIARTRKRGIDPRAVEAGLWSHVAAHAASVPEHETERLRRVAALRRHTVDATHPPTHLRRALLAASEPLPARITFEAATVKAVDAELAGARRRVAQAFMRDLIS